MTEVERRSSSTTEVKKDPFRYVPDIIDERSREVEGLVLNRYTKGLLLGKGGFAQVYLSSHLASKQQFALKIVAKSSLTKPRAKSKLQTEIKIHRALNHINIVRFQRFFEDPNFAYLVLELCSNNAMSDLLTARKRITETETRYYLHQLVSSLQYLHRHLVIHRDLKLGNIFIDAQMRIKVGDFGLATKLEHPDERRMTVCGTPNYIAPELLDEAKKGHSFEVDIWSTGVIMYTLLVGKPPFQSKDVKATYKRIMANEYSYPADSMVSVEAKDLVGSMLKRRPEERLSLVGILEHEFFTAPHVFTPTSLPESALKIVPDMGEIAPSVKSLTMEKKSEGKMPAFGDENDPNAINRLPTANKEHRHATPALNAEQQQAFAFKKRTDSAPDTARSATSAGSAASMASAIASATNTAARITASEPPKTEQPSSSRQVAARMRTGVSTRSTIAPAVPTTNSSAATTTASTTASSISTSSRLEKRSEETYAEMYNRVKTSSTSSTATSVATTAPTSSSARTKFDVYMDSNTASSRPSSTTNKENITKPTNSKEMPAYNYIESHIQTKQVPSSSAPVLHDAHHTPVTSSVDKLQQEFQHIHLHEQNIASSSSGKQVTPPTAKLVPAPSSDMVEHISQSREDRWKDSSEKLQPKTKRVKEAWIATTTSSMEGQKMQSQLLPTTVTTPTAAVSSSSSSHYTDMNNLAQASVASTATAAMQSEAMHIGTPNEGAHKQLLDHHNIGTLEKMHEMLNENSFSFVDAPRQLNMPASTSTANPHNNNGGSFSRVWVVRYVDYTSKYGLGFLFNTGSAGVYFNDSTKIVLSACGNIFQYVERKSRDSLSNREHVCQKYSMEDYPKELQKKVTLLKHFRNYLVDQEKNHAASNTAQANEAIANAFGGNGVEDCGGYNRQRIQEQIEGDNDHISLDNDLEMPFLKKWIRTKHAILFRMSNRTVQVVFYDRSEVLLSSEARQITYVNKSGDRSEHMLDDIVLSGRVDIAKRLKYTKEIMHRLINAK